MMMNLRRLGLLTPISLYLLLALSGLSGCADETQPSGNVDSANGGDDDDDDSSNQADDDDDGEPAAADSAVKDAGRPSSSKPDGGGGSSTRVDAAKPPPVDEPASDAGKTGNVPDASGAGDASGGSNSDSDASSGGGERADLGKGDGKDVITIGDSWMSLGSTGIQQSLLKVSGQPYRTYGRGGTKLLDGVIPRQYMTAKTADPDIKTVVMTGGGNDIIQDPSLPADCMTGGSACEAQVDRIRTGLVNLWTQMSTDGVQDVIHVMYSVNAGRGVKNRDEHNKKMAEVCAAVPPPLRCHLLNTDMIIGKAEMSGDNIHPTAAGYDKLGKAVFELMGEKGMRR